jgi:hypothetical protein
LGCQRSAPGADIVCRHVDDLADGAFVQQFSNRLNSGVRKVSGAEPTKRPFSAANSTIIGLFKAVGQGLFAVYMLAGLQGGHGQAVVGSGVGQNDDDINFGIRQHFFGGVDFGNIPACSGSFCRFGVQVRTAHRAQVFEHGTEGAEVMVAIDAGTNYAIAKNSFFHLQSPFHLLKIDEKLLLLC